MKVWQKRNQNVRLRQWFSSFRAHWKYWESIKNYGCLGPFPEVGAMHCCSSNASQAILLCSRHEGTNQRLVETTWNHSKGSQEGGISRRGSEAARALEGPREWTSGELQLVFGGGEQEVQESPETTEDCTATYALRRVVQSKPASLLLRGWSALSQGPLA